MSCNSPKFLHFITEIVVTDDNLPKQLSIEIKFKWQQVLSEPFYVGESFISHEKNARVEISRVPTPLCMALV